MSLGIVFIKMMISYPNKVCFAWWQWWAVGFRNLHIELDSFEEESVVL